MLKIRFLHKRVKQNRAKTVNSNGNVKPKHIGNEGENQKKSSVVRANEMATATITHIHIGSTMKHTKKQQRRNY